MKTDRNTPMTARQRQVLDFIRRRIRERGFPPTIREIARGFGFSSNNGVMAHLAALEKRELIYRDARKSRSIVLTEPVLCPHCGKSISEEVET